MESMQVSRCKLKKTLSTSAPKKTTEFFKTADIRVAGSRICTWIGAFPLVPFSQVSFLMYYTTM